MERETYAYRLVEGATGIVAAKVEAANDARARRDIDHYAMMYGQDGPVMVQQRVGKRWRFLYGVAPGSDHPA